MVPRPARVGAQVGAAVGPEEEARRDGLPLRLRRLPFLRRHGAARGGRPGDDELVTVGMDLPEEVFAERLPAVVRDGEGVAEDVDALVVDGVDPDLAEVEGARVQARGADPRARRRPPSGRPRPARLSISSIPLVPPASLWTTAMTTFGFAAETARPMRPVCAGRPFVSFVQVAPPSVERKMPPASRPPVRDGAVREGPRGPPPRVERRVDDVRVGGGEDDVDAAGVGVVGRGGREDLRPALPAVGRPVEAALAPLRPEVARGGDEGDVGVRRVDADPPDGAARRQPGVRPRRPAVRRAEDAVAEAGAVAVRRLARPDPDHPRVRRGDGDGADREDPLVLHQAARRSRRRSSSSRDRPSRARGRRWPGPPGRGRSRRRGRP